MTQARLLGGRYQVGELLGYGGMAEVHRGRDLRLGRDVAIKMLRTDLARDDTFQLRFRREAQNAASLNHPAIVAVYDTGEERGSSGESLPYIVMEFVNGRTLKELLQAEGRLMPRRAMEITAEICAALEFSHRHGIIHRDIKPGNVMLTQTGQIKVMDFGIARALANSGSTMTQTSAVIGTAQYLSPEQARGEPVDARSDVYATGCVLYELLTGQPPFIGDSPVSVAYQHVREDARPPSLINRDVPPPVDAVVLKALAKNPLNRYQSAAEMRADLLRASQGRPVLAEPVMFDEGATRQLRPPGAGRPGSGRPPVRRKSTNWQLWGLAGLAGVAVLVLIIGLIVTSGPDQATVPPLVGQSQQQADAVLELRGLKAEPKPKADTSCSASDVENHVVKSQNPDPNVKVDKGTTVTYEYCSGTGEETIPLTVIDMPKDQAKTLLEDLGFVVTLEPADSAKPLDAIVRTDPAAGQTVPGGSPITVFFSKGNFKVVPNLVGQNEESARSLLHYFGFTAEPEVLIEVTTDPSRIGVVVSQAPAADAEADPSRPVRIVIGQAPAATTTPPPPTGSDTPPPTA